MSLFSLSIFYFSISNKMRKKEKLEWNEINLDFLLSLKLVQHGLKLLGATLIELRGLDPKSLVAYGLSGDNLFTFIAVK